MRARRGHGLVSIAGLYVLIDPAACKGFGAIATARLALESGASVIQWRDKLRDKGLQLADARQVLELCAEHEAAFIINDHADLALVLAREFGDGTPLGVHVGQKDLPVAAVRMIVPPGFIVGASTNNVAEAVAAAAAGASYIAVGDIFGTGSKEGTRPASPALLAEVKAAVNVPVVGIGGINLGNAGEVIRAGADAVAVISAVCGADDPRAAAAALVRAIQTPKGP
jgi:thiamine-phosphate pyrophosphorylase